MTEISLELPWPHPDLSPNARLHFHALAKAKAKARSEAGWIAKSVPKPVFDEGNIPISLMFHPVTKRHYDLDGLLSRCKAALDGIAEAWDINDVRFRPITINMGDPIRGGKVFITFHK